MSTEPENDGRDTPRRRGDLTNNRESDVDTDDAVANSRDTGGGDGDDGDAASTTGTGATEQFVGRVAGQDEGYAGETGAEARAAAER